jgi:hypothetical protein
MRIAAPAAALPDEVAAVRRARALAFEARAEELGSLLDSFADPTQLRVALIDTLSMAQAVSAAGDTVEAELANEAFERHLVALVIEACRAEPESALEPFARACGGFNHVHCAEEVDAARAAFARRRRLGSTERGAFLSAPRAARRLLEVAADGFEDGLTLDEGLVLRERLARSVAALETTAAPAGNEELCESLRQSARRALRRLDAALRARPERAGFSAERLKTMTVLANLAAHELAREDAAERLEVARVVSEVCATEMRRIGLREVSAHLLLTSSRQAFNGLIAPDKRAHRVQGAYYPSINLVVLSPGHSALMCQPDERYPLYPVFMHEEAHASASNAEALKRCEIEREVAEGYAEKVVSVMLPELSKEMSALHRRPVVYRSSDSYRRQEAVLDAIAARAGIPDEALLARLSHASDMVELLAQDMLGVDRERGAEAIRRYLAGDDLALAA